MAKSARTPQTKIKIGTKRPCDMCAKRYMPKTEHHRFCLPKCRLDFHRFGPVLVRLRDRIAHEVQEATATTIANVTFAFWQVLDAPQRQKFASADPTLAKLLRQREAEGE